MSKMLFFDIETHSADKRHDMEPREFFRLGQYAWDDGPVVLTEDYDEFMAVVDAAPYVVGHNIFAFDLPALYGNESLRPLQRGQFRRAVDTMILAHLLTPAPYSYTSRNGHTYYDAAAPNNAMRYYSLDNLAFQFNLPGKMGDLKELAKKHNPPKTLVRDLDFGLIPTDDPEFREYAEGDIVAVRALYKHLLWVLSTSDYDRDYIWREMEIAAVNARITSNGIYIDTAAARATVDEQARSREEILTWLVNDFDFPTEGKQPWKSDAGKEAIQRILATYGIVFGEHPEWTATEKGAPSFAGDTLIAITAGTDAEHIGIALAELQGQRSMAQLALESTHADGKAHPDITMFQRSGRFSYLRPGLTVWDTPNKHVFLADPGHVAVELDFSNADARAVAALSGDREYAKRFDTDEDGNDLYDGHNLNGEALFGKGDYYAPGYDDHGRPILRPLAKLCIAAGEEVLTDGGLVPIENVTTDMLLWDGEGWVSHGGLISRGTKEAISYGGLTATPDHRVFVWQEGEVVDVPFELAARIGARLVQTGTGGDPVRIGEGGEPRTSLPALKKHMPRSRRVFGLWGRRVGAGVQPQERVHRVSFLSGGKETALPLLAGAQIDRRKAAVREPRQAEVQTVWGARNPVRVPQRPRRSDVHLRELLASGSKLNNRQGGFKWGLRTGEHSNGDRCRESVQPTNHRVERVQPKLLALLPGGGAQTSRGGFDKGRHNRPRPTGGQEQIQELARDRRKVEVYDIRLAGPRNRFTVSGVLVHNCGHALNYNAGAKKLTSEANKACKTLGIDREFETGDLYDMINNFESTFPRLAAWKNRVVREGESGAVVNAWGRRMVIDKVWDKARGEHRSRSYTQAPALHGQSTTREVMSDALIKLARLGGDWPYRIKGVIHDALWVCLPKETVDTDIRKVVECMETVFHPKGGIPIPFPVGVGPTGAENFRDASH